MRVGSPLMLCRAEVSNAGQQACWVLTVPPVVSQDLRMLRKPVKMKTPQDVTEGPQVIELEPEAQIHE